MKRPRMGLRGTCNQIRSAPARNRPDDKFTRGIEGALGQVPFGKRCRPPAAGPPARRYRRVRPSAGRSPGPARPAPARDPCRRWRATILSLVPRGTRSRIGRSPASGTRPRAPPKSFASPTISPSANRKPRFERAETPVEQLARLVGPLLGGLQAIDGDDPTGARSARPKPTMP